MSFAFAGTPLFASLVLRELVELGHMPRLVISQPDRPRGRGRSAGTPQAVSEAACHGLECIQTEDINSAEVAERLAGCGVSTLVVAAFGQLLKRPLLDAHSCINIHASLLPRYRGAAPIERALMAGEKSTGVCVMQITEELDGGPWAERVEVSLGTREDAGSVLRMLAVTGAVALGSVLDGLTDGTVCWTEQQGEVSYARKLTAADSWLDVSGGAEAAHNQVRALSPGVGARAVLGEAEVKIWRTWPYGTAHHDDTPCEGEAVHGRAGEVLILDSRLFIGCGGGVLEVMELQPACRARMTTQEYLRGYAGSVGTKMKVPPVMQARGEM